MKRQYVTGIALWFMCGVLMAQNETDAFRYAQYSPTGTARYTSLAGSMGGFGADFTVLSANNPAGIGLYKRSEIALTTTLQYINITSSYNGSSHTYGSYKFRLHNLGFVLSVPVSSNWKYIQFATGYNNLARYDGDFSITGPNQSTNVSTNGTTNFFDYIAEQGSRNRIASNRINNGNNPTAMWEEMFPTLWDFYILDTIAGTTDQYYSIIGDKFDQKQTISTKGHLSEYVFSMGGNYNDQIYLGATIGIPFFRYEQKTVYTEPRNVFFDELIYTNELSSRATGINFKFGILYQPFKFLRFGAGIHTPTLFSKVQETSVESFFVSNYYYPVDSSFYNFTPSNIVNKFNYQLITPYHVIGNIAFLFDRYGFLNIDYEYVDYRTSQMQSRDYEFATENNNITQYYQGTHNIRAGVEINLTPVAFRLGYSYTSNPYKDIEKDGTTHIITGGIGYKSRYFFMDFAYRYRMLKDKNVFYNASNINPYTTELVNQQFALTLGWKIGK